MPAASTVLTGLGLATGIARDVTDGVPLVKQVLGAASRIVGLAEQIDKSREDLHALADRARRMDATIAGVVAGNELDDKMLSRLEAVNGVLRAIEQHFARHIKKRRVNRALGYMFTVRKEVERLTGDFDNRLRELELTANMYSGILTREDARFVGEIRNIRHCEISLLRRITSPARNTTSCHLATCDGSSQVLVVRYAELSSRSENRFSRRIEAHDAILERLSLIQNRHPSIAFLYGKNLGPTHNRFVVLSAGDIRPLVDVLPAATSEVSILGRIVTQLVDAACHLHRHGVEWNCPTPIDLALDLYLDRNFEPKIGIHADDFSAMSSSPERQAGAVALTLASILNLYNGSYRAQGTQFPNLHLQSSAWSTQLFGELVDAGYCVRCNVNVVKRADIAGLVPLSRESRTYLHLADDSCKHLGPIWGNILLHLATGHRKRHGSFLHAEYQTRQTNSTDSLIVCCIEDGVDMIYHKRAQFEIPRSASGAVMERLGIAAEDGGEAIGSVWFHLLRVATAGATSSESFSWSSTWPDWTPW